MSAFTGWLRFWLRESGEEEEVKETKALLILRCSRVFKSRIIAYLHTHYECTLRASAGDFIALSTADADGACAAVKKDANLKRAVESAYVVDQWTTSAGYVALLVAAARAGAASGGGVRLSVYPKSVRKELEEALPQEVQLKPHGHDAVLHVVKLDDEDMSMKLYAWALRPVYTTDYSGRSTPSGYPSSEEDEGGPSTAAAAASTGEEQDLVAEGVRRGLFQLTQPALLISEGWRKVPQVLHRLGDDCTQVAPIGKALELQLPARNVVRGPPFGSAAVLLGVDHERLATLLTDTLPPLLLAGASLVVNFQLPREERGAAGEAAINGLKTRLAQSGYEEVCVEWLFANGPTERTLVCKWKGRGFVSAESSPVTTPVARRLRGVDAYKTARERPT